LESKDIKRQALQEMLHYVGTTRGAVPESIYPEVVRMVRNGFDMFMVIR
jgi:serine/threonine-protein phosphatase 2A regulatory subunit B'